MASIFIQPSRRLALRSGTRAFSMSRTSLLKPSASLYGFSIDDYDAKPKSDLDISKEILQKRMDLGILQLQMKEIRRSIFRAKVNRRRARKMRFIDMLPDPPGFLFYTEWNRGQNSSALFYLPLPPHGAFVQVIFRARLPIDVRLRA
ncbi:hypothetical protein B9Z19DRAFT_1118394 [Tuber borchii]|uniref:Uncharacterized protein n=1 Tax=Tuber borchii TaxID=42251 RepID=A0A2T7A8N1_TUBBO|nr:hypothetical protein B9Z19DRAFT_1118394 [Tuber borchii]